MRALTRWQVGVDALVLTHWCWHTGVDLLVLMYWYWSIGVDAFVLRRRCWHFGVDALVLTHWCWCTGVEALVLTHWCYLLVLIHWCWCICVDIHTSTDSLVLMWRCCRWRWCRRCSTRTTGWHGWILTCGWGLDITFTRHRRTRTGQRLRAGAKFSKCEWLMCSVVVYGVLMYVLMLNWTPGCFGDVMWCCVMS